MNIIRNARQTEFLDIREFLKQHGHNDASIAKAIGKSKAMISKYVNEPDTIPPESALISLRLIVKGLEARASEKYPQRTEDLVGSESADLREATSKLGDIHRSDPERFRTVTEMITIVHEKAKAKPPNSDVPSDIGDRVQRAAASTAKKVRYPRPRSSPK